jgi:hypothetical protein
VDLKASLDAVEKRISLDPAENRTPALNPSQHQLRYTTTKLFFTVTFCLSLVLNLYYSYIIPTCEDYIKRKVTLSLLQALGGGP